MAGYTVEYMKSSLALDSTTCDTCRRT